MRIRLQIHFTVRRHFDGKMADFCDWKLRLARATVCHELNPTEKMEKPKKYFSWKKLTLIWDCPVGSQSNPKSSNWFDLRITRIRCFSTILLVCARSMFFLDIFQADGANVLRLSNGTKSRCKLLYSHGNPPECNWFVILAVPITMHNLSHVLVQFLHFSCVFRSNHYSEAFVSPHIHHTIKCDSTNAIIGFFFSCCNSFSPQWFGWIFSRFFLFQMTYTHM